MTEEERTRRRIAALRVKGKTARALYDWVRKNIRYRPAPVERTYAGQDDLRKLDVRCSECDRLLQTRMCLGVHPRTVARKLALAGALACPAHPNATELFVIDGTPMAEAELINH